MGWLCAGVYLSKFSECVLDRNLPFAFGGERLAIATPEMPCTHLILRRALVVKALDKSVEFDVFNQVKVVGVRSDVMEDLIMVWEISVNRRRPWEIRELI